MPELSKDIIGRKLDPYKIKVERCKIKEFCMAIGENNPIYLDVDEAKKAGFNDTPIPPTFQTSFMFWGNAKFWTDLPAMGIDIERLLHMKEEYTYRQTVYPDEILTAEGEVIDVKIGKMDMVTFKTTFIGEDGKPRIDAVMGIVMRPEGS